MEYVWMEFKKNINYCEEWHQLLCKVYNGQENELKKK